MNNEQHIEINKDWWWFFNEFNEEDIPKYVEENLPRDIVSNELIEKC